MRVLAAYALIFYGIVVVAAIPGDIRQGRMASGAALPHALDGITMVFAALGLLMGFAWATAVAVAAVIVASALALYHTALIERGLSLERHWMRTLIALVLIGLLVFGN